MLIVQQKVKYHPPKELNTSKQKNKCRTNNKNKPPNKQTRKKKIPSTNLWGLLLMVLDISMLCKLFLLDLSTAINL
jgi:hypothetical protein